MKPDGQLSTSPTATSDLKLPWVGRRVSLTARDSGYNVQEAFYNELQVPSTTIVRQALAAPCLLLYVIHSWNLIHGRHTLMTKRLQRRTDVHMQIGDIELQLGSDCYVQCLLNPVNYV
jgi:hypothetical protein